MRKGELKLIYLPDLLSYIAVVDGEIVD